MARKPGFPWAPTSLPPMRRQWCELLSEGLERLRDQPAMSGLVPQADDDLSGLENSSMYWVSRDMTDLAVSAAASLPEWSPAAAIPEEFGLIAWAKPVGTFDWPVPGSTQRQRMPVDLMSWGIRGSSVGVGCAFRTDRFAKQLGPLARYPLISHPIGMWDLEDPVSHRLDGGAVSPMSVLGSAWLLMGQVRIVETRTIAVPGAGQPAAGDAGGAVSLIELRRAARGGSDDAASGRAARRSDKRWWVTGHWRDARVGPKRSLRRPVWISPYIKGDPEAELSERVSVWRR